MRLELVSYYWSGDILRSRGVSDVVLSGVLEVPPPSARLMADWQREITLHLQLEPGEVQSLPLARARPRWPDYGRCVQAMTDWTGSLCLPQVLVAGEVALMASRGAHYHHDGACYGSAAFCNLFLSDDQGLDLHFPTTGRRIPLVRGTAVIFDTGQPHAVVPRGSDRFDAADFALDPAHTQVFLSWELPIEDAHMSRALQIAFDIDPSTAARLEEEQVWCNGAPAQVWPATGQWQRLA